MTQKLLLSLLFFLISFSVLSQKNIDPNDEDIKLADKLKEQFPDDNLALEISKDLIKFKLNYKTHKVSVTHRLIENYINLNSRADIIKYAFYDGETTITDFSIRYKNNKYAYFKTKDEAYTKNGLFHQDTRVKYAHIDFPLKGYKYNVSVSKEYKDIKYLTKLYFTDDYPTVEKTIQIEIPTWLDIEIKELNFEGYNIEKKITTNKKNKIITYTARDIHATYNDDKSPGPTYIYPHLLILTKSYVFNKHKIKIFETTQDLYDWYKSLTNSLTNNTDSFKGKVTELTKGCKNDNDKIKNIFYWIQDNIRYIAFEDGIAGFKPAEASEVFNKKYGDCKGMANLTKQMLKEAGFDARLTWIGTKRIAYDYSTPNLAVDNHMICTLLKDGDTIFLDATEKFNAFGEFAYRIQDKQALIENGDTYILKYVPANKASFNKEIIDYNLTLEGENLIGQATKKFVGESRTSLLYYFNTIKNDKKDEYLEWYLNDDNSNIKVSNIKTSDLSNRDIPLNISYNISIKNAVSSFDDILYIDIDIDKELNRFNFDKRKTDYLFNYKKDLESTITLTFPDNYKISKIPKNIAINSRNYELNVQFTIEGNTVVYKKHFVIKNAKIETSDFDKWNAFIKNLQAIYNEQIILSKK